MKVGIIGAGAVGTACVISLILRGCAREIVVIDRDTKRAEGVVTDMQYGAVVSPMVTLRAGGYEDLKGAELVMITAGVNEKTGGATDRNDPQGRLKLLGTNAKVYREVVPKIVAVAPEAVLMVVTDPPDPLAQLTRELCGHDRVISAGTYLDSMRFCWHLAQHLGVSAGSVQADVLGEHGTSQVYMWSTVSVGGVPMRNFDPKLCETIEHEVRYANISIIEGIGASQHGIGMICARIAEIILRDERVVIPVGSYQKSYGATLSLPSVVGKGGVIRVLEPVATEREKVALQKSAETIKTAFSQI